VSVLQIALLRFDDLVRSICSALRILCNSLRSARGLPSLREREISC